MHLKEAVMLHRRITSVGAALALALLAMASGPALRAQTPIQNNPAAAPQRDPLNPAPNRASGEGFGPYRTMVIRGAILIDGSGAPPHGPVDIIVEGNRITGIRS